MRLLLLLLLLRHALPLILPSGLPATRKFRFKASK